MARRSTRRTLEELFLRRVDKRLEQPQHWLWTGHVEHGAPFFNGRAKSKSSGRQLAWLVTYGQAADGALQSTCGEQLCVNPAHMRVCGTDNIRDQAIRERWKKHLEHAPFTTTMSKLGAEYGISKNRIEQIVNGRKK